MPERLRTLKKRAKKFGATLEEPSSGSHYKFRSKDRRAYPVSAHNGLKSEIPDVYIRGLARFLGVSVDELLGK